MAYVYNRTPSFRYRRHSRGSEATVVYCLPPEFADPVCVGAAAVVRSVTTDKIILANEDHETRTNSTARRGYGQW